MEKKRAKQFLKKPEFPGGNKAFRDFIQQNLVYPAEALKNKIEGTVIIKAEINDNGEVENAVVTHGLGYGCDEEALRLVKLLRYSKVKNRGLRLKVSKIIKIAFVIPKNVAPALQYHYTTADKKDESPQHPDNSKKNEVYNWQIKIK